MTESFEQFEQMVFDTSQEVLDLQQVRFKQKWLPQVLDTLLLLPANCLERLRFNLDWPASMADERYGMDELKMFFSLVYPSDTQSCLYQTHSVMAEMAEKEVAEYWDAVTLAGLLSEEGPQAPGPTPEELANLACQDAMEEAVMQSLVEFEQTVFQALSAWQPGKNHGQIYQMGQAAAQRWQGRLTTTCRTLVHESYTRVMDWVLSKEV